MTIVLKQNIQIKEVYHKTNIQIMNYLKKYGTTVGKKYINQQYIAPIIEFDDYTRIWILEREIDISKR